MASRGRILGIERALICGLLIVPGGSCGPGSPPADSPLPDAEAVRQSLLSSDRAFNQATLGSPTLASASVPLAAQNADVQGAWSAERYIMKAGAEHRVEGRIFFTESDWQVVFFVVDEEGDIKRGSAEGGTYTLEGDALTFRHLHNFSTGEAMEGLEEAPLRMVYRDPEDASEEAANERADKGDSSWT